MPAAEGNNGDKEIDFILVSR